MHKASNQQQLCSTMVSKNGVSANIKLIDTSIKNPISGWSTTVVKGCMHIMFDMVHTAFCLKRINHLLISSGIFQCQRK